MYVDDDNVLHGPEVSEPDVTAGLGAFFWEKLHEHGDKVAQIQQVGDVEVVMTYCQVLRSARRIGALLAHHGVGVADTVLLCCGNTVNYMPVMAATQFVGAALAAVDPDSTTADLLHLLGVVQPKLCISNAAAHRNAQAALAQHPCDVTHLRLEALPGGGANASEDGANATLGGACAKEGGADAKEGGADAKEGGADAAEGVAELAAPAQIGDSRQHVAFVMSSSGTSGRPKGVELTSAACLAQVYAQQYLWKDLPSGFQLTALNLSGPYWVSCLVLQTMCLAAGARLVLLSDFTVDSYLSHVEKYKVNLSLLSPDKMAALAKHDTARSYDLSSLRLVTCGGNPVSRPVLKQVESRLGMRILPFYAMTEATCVVRIAVGLPDRPGSVGVLFQNVQCKTVDPETGATLGVGVEGELCFRSALAMKGYRGDEAATRAAIDADGFLHTGDVGYFDAEGYVFIVDRVKELIKYRGNHVPAVELEDVLMTHDDVMDVAVVGLRHTEDWEHATAFVVKRAGSDVIEQQLVELVQDRLPPGKWLHGGVRFIDELPRTATGKVKKRDLRTLGHSQR